MVGALEEEARNSSALRSVRVMAIPAMAFSADPPTESEARPICNPPSHTHRPLVSFTSGLSLVIRSRIRIIAAPLSRGGSRVSG